MKLGLGSYAYRWSIGHKDRVPSKPLDCLELLDITSKLGLGVLQIADNMPVHNITKQTLDNLSESAKSQGIDLEIGLQSFSPETTKEYLQIAERLNAKILRIALDGNVVQTSDDSIANEFKNILPIAEKIKCKNPLPKISFQPSSPSHCRLFGTLSFKRDWQARRTGKRWPATPLPRSSKIF